VTSARADDLARIDDALAVARRVLTAFVAGAVRARSKAGGSLVTEADLAVDSALAPVLCRSGEGWLSEETADGTERLAARRVWVVDPIDGTRHFVDGSDEWSVSIALVEDGEAVAGGVTLPARDLTIVGALGLGVRVDGRPARVRSGLTLARAEILVSRSEHERGEWADCRDAPFGLRPQGSIAAKLALVAGGLADATWTLRPRHEWDIAAGVALVAAAGGEVWIPHGGAPRFNQPRPILPGVCAAPPDLAPEIRAWLARPGASSPGRS
jgi:myo-inositol-1(or 4)-monophosphatase